MANSEFYLQEAARIGTSLDLVIAQIKAIDTGYATKLDTYLGIRNPRSLIVFDSVPSLKGEFFLKLAKKRQVERLVNGQLYQLIKEYNLNVNSLAISETGSPAINPTPKTDPKPDTTPEKGTGTNTGNGLVGTGTGANAPATANVTNTNLYIILGIVLIVGVVVVYFITNKKKK